MRASALIGLADLFGIDPAAVRMALGRLVRDRMARQIDRGVYALGPAASALHLKARSWADVEQVVQPWRGGWLFALTGHLGRTNRPQLAARERALRLSGFAPTANGAWARPDNLRRGAGELAGELIGLGLEAEAMILSGCVAQPQDEAKLRALWSVEELEFSYRYWTNELLASEDRVAKMPIRDAARETYLLGQSVLRTINSDPLLPAEMVDVDARGQMVRAMIHYNQVALRYWYGLGHSAP